VATGSFEITDDTQDDAPEIDPELHVPGSIEVDDVMVPAGEEPGDRGLQIRASGLEPDTSYTFRVVPPAENPDLEAEFGATSDENGDASGSYFIEWSGDYLADALAGTYRVELLDADDEVLDQADVEFVVGDADDDDDDQGEGGEDDGQDDGDQDQDDQDDDGQDEAADPSVTVDPKELSAAAFIDYDRGVQVTARDCAPGQTVDLEVFWPGTDDVAYADGIEADEDGTAGFSFYGTGDRASAAHTEPGDAKRPKCGTDSFGSHRLIFCRTCSGTGHTKKEGRRSLALRAPQKKKRGPNPREPPK
jgi:hypothetical protein